MAAGGLLPDEMMLELITTKLDTLKETVSILPSSSCHAWLTRSFIELDPGRLPTYAATRKVVGQFPRVSRALLAAVSND